MMRTLVFITSHFPFGRGETFIESEFSFLSRNFEKILIIAQDISGGEKRKIPDNIIICRYNTATSLLGFFYLPVIFILNSQKIIKLIRDEIKFRLNIDKRFPFKKFLYLVKKIFKAFQLSEFIKNELEECRISENIVFYSYWFKTGAHAVALMDCPGSIKISRAHGSDIYEEKTDSGYLPLMGFAAENLDAIFFISENGKRFFLDKIKKEKAGFIVSRLGIDNPYAGKSRNAESEKFVIVSCSNMIALKRIDLIIRSLELIRLEKQIKWMHFGDGILKKELQSLAEDLLSKNEGIEYRFMGHFPNKELLEFYSTNRIDLFINVSSTEGLPVSIMEAQSAGMPVIATNVGGVSEIVVEGTGTLIDQDFETDQLTNLITYYYNLPESQIQKIRENAYNNWENGFNASVNYSKFIESINVIFASANQ